MSTLPPEACWDVSVGPGDKLGLVLDQKAGTPTITRVAGGSCGEAVLAGARLAAGMQLTKVGDTDVTGLGYRAVADVIKSHLERPLRLRLCLGAMESTAPQVAVTPLRKLRPEELAARSKRATDEGIRKVMEALKDRADESSGSDDDSDSDGDRPRRVHRKGVETDPSGRRADSAAVANLERRLHYMQLDLANATVAVAEANAKAALPATQLEPLAVADDALGKLRELQAPFDEAATMTHAQLQKALTSWRAECMQHAEAAAGAIESIDLADVKRCLTAGLVAERKRLAIVETRGSAMLWRARVRDTAATASLYAVAAAGVSVACMAFAG